MKLTNINDAVLIKLSASVIMCGGYFLNISKDNNGIIVAWATIADGGAVVENSEKKYLTKDFNTLLGNLESIELPTDEDEDAGVQWTISITDSDDNELLLSKELLYQNDGRLTGIYELLLDFLGDDEPLLQLKEMLRI